MQSICLKTQQTERKKVSVWWWKAEDGIFPYTCEETDWSHFILVPGCPGFISFAGAGRANCRQLIRPTCSKSCFSFRKLSTRRSRHYAEHQGAPLNKTRIPFRCILSHLPKEVLIWFSLRTLWKTAYLKCTSDRAACSGLRRGRGWPPTVDLYQRGWNNWAWGGEKTWETCGALQANAALFIIPSLSVNYLTLQIISQQALITCQIHKNTHTHISTSWIQQ